METFDILQGISILYYSNVITVGLLEICWRNDLKSETSQSLNADMYHL